MKTATTTCLVLLLATTWGCKSKSEDEGGDESAGAKETASGEAAGGEKAAGGEAPAEAAATAAVAGFVSFEVNGEAKKFEYLPKDKNMATSVTTVVHAAPEAGSKEHFSVMLNLFDARKGEYPTDLELNLTFDPKEHKSPADVAKSPKPMVVYESPDGLRYGGYNKVKLESFEGGVLKGTAEDIELHAGKDGGEPLKFSSIQFEAALDAPVPGAIDEAMGKTIE